VIVRTFSVGPLQENCYLVVDDAAHVAALIDPGDEAPRLLKAVADAGATLSAIWITHAHFDHVGAVAEIVRQTKAPIWLHPLEQPLWSYASRSAAAYGLQLENPPPPDHELADGGRVTLGALTFDVLHAPGHAPGHVVLHGHGVAFVGDCLFAGSIGRTDLPLSNPSSLAASLKKIAALPDETVVYAGHGPPTTIGEEKQTNPFLNGTARVVGG
jgi:glyoxylase-like metal-dependent hydrolase (beta-lactamase superfamily II)